MDSLFWKRLNPEIVYEPTRKQFFGKYCYKLVFKAYGSRCINENRFDSIEEAIQYRISNYRHHNYAGSWRGNHLNELNSVDYGLLNELRAIKSSHGGDIKMRIEEPWLQIYAQDEDTLKVIASRFDDYSKKSIISVSTPESADYETQLKQDVIIVKKDNGFKYKIFFRDGNYGHDVKVSLYNYLLAIGADIRYPNSVEKQLTSTHGWIWGCYFYTVDSSITTALNLIQPGIIGKIHELVVRKL